MEKMLLNRNEIFAFQKKNLFLLNMQIAKSHGCAAQFTNIYLGKKTNNLGQELKNNLTHMGRHNRMLEREDEWLNSIRPIYANFISIIE